MLPAKTAQGMLDVGGALDLGILSRDQKTCGLKEPYSGQN